MKCLRCPETELLEHRGALLEAICPRCQGRLLDAGASGRVLEEYCSLDRALVGELCAHYRGKVPCPACSRGMSRVPVATVVVDLCGGCGALFLDRGELGRLTHRAIREIEVPPPFEIPTAATTTVSAPSTPSTSAAIPALPASLGASPASPVTGSGRTGARDAAVYLREPLGIDDVPLLLEVWRRAGFRTAVDARAMIGRACGGILADDCSAEEASRLVDVARELGRAAVVVSDSAVAVPGAFRQKELGITPGTVAVADGLGRRRELPAAEIRILAAGRSRVVVTEQAAPTAPIGGLARKAATAFAPRVVTRALERAEPQRGPSTTMVEREQLFVDVVIGNERFRLDEAGFVARADGPRDLAGLAVRLDEVAPPGAFRQRGFRALLMRQPVPQFRSLRELDREVTWSAWRRQLSS